MELELGLGLPNNKPAAELGLGFIAQPCRKRGFEGDKKTTLPLFVWKGGDDDDDDSGDNGYLINKEDEWSGKELVGWPPVKYRRWNDDRRNAKCVKVKMEGVGIGRKVNLSLHHCYESLLHALKGLFPYHFNVGVNGFDEHIVTYEDGEGDWLLIGDVPWEVFLQSVKSIKILARSAA
ncbi:AUX/IAA protein [Dioscorea alata]|uniref:AUX/IAA protein n=1 Tax=Dioscorea alata TaxID=55571 RepID=A0ACB7VM47_DIOAL|nr:AUX/IAA protein [Dioscorea alata]